MNFERYNIEAEIDYSFRHRTALVVKLKNKEDVFVTAVKNYLPTAEIKVVEFEPLTLYGYPVSSPKVVLHQIEGVIPVSANFDDPLYQSARSLKAKFLSKK